MVQHLSSTELPCPICLDTDMQCPRITKCGHSFCFTCLIHHVQASSQATNDTAVKCPCCSLPIFLPDVRPVEIVVVDSTSMRFVKLHRQRQSSVPYIPLPDCPRRHGHNLPSANDPDASFSRFQYVDPTTYQSLLYKECQELVNDATNSSTMEELCRSSALQMIQQDLARIELELPWELSAIQEMEQQHQEHPRYLLAAVNNSEESPPISRRARVDSIASVASSCGSVRSTHSNSASALQGSGGSMYADEQDEFTLYQAENGTLCFLSGFNMNCLRTEYSPGPPSLCKDMASLDLQHDGAGSPVAAAARTGERPKLPLPDVVEGKVIEVEHVHLTADMRQRRRFLAHLPLYTDLCFVELNLGSYLSHNTKQEFRKEFQKRKQKRVQRANAEKRADKKIEQQERERIEGLRAVFQQIDPTDEFFQYTPREPEPERAIDFSSEVFGPPAAFSNATIARPTTAPEQTGPSSSAAISFSQVCRAGEDFPSLQSAPTESNFPALGSSSAAATTTTTRGGWGSAAAKKSQPLTTLTPLTNKKGKAKKVVLFSTGAQRGDL